MHPIAQTNILQLFDDLEAEEAQGFVRVNCQGPLRLYTYTEKATYEGHWTPAVRASRGLILDDLNGKIVALPFPKFFNYSQLIDPIPDLPFVSYEKMDGSLIICWYYGGSWHTSTKGSFNSPQAYLAQNKLNYMDTSVLDKTCTYLFELVGPSNKIVIPYPVDKLVLLSGYTLFGEELSWEEIHTTAWELCVSTPKIFPYESLSDMVRDAESLSRNSEGFVVRFTNGTRVKIKGAEYLAVHRLISQLSPLSIWAIAKDTPNQLEALRRELPEELWEDFDQILNQLSSQLRALDERLYALNEQTKHLTDKELGLSLPTLDPPLRNFIFPYRKSNGILEGRFREGVFQYIRPTGNYLEGYRASSSMNRVHGELL